jgi:hypothetical protein
MPEEEQDDHNENSVPTIITSQENGQESPREERPPLPPRPGELGLLSSRTPATQGTNAKLRGSLLSHATTAVSMTDVNTYTRGDGLRDTHTSMPKRVPTSPSVHRFGSARNSDAGEDASSIRSFMPNAQMSDDMVSLFGDGVQSTPATGIPSLEDREVHHIDHEVDIDFEREFAEVRGDDQEDAAIYAWKSKKKHFIILSAAGKPIYTRHGSDSLISNYVGIIQTIISFYQSACDPLRSFSAGDAKFVVLSQTNLFLVAISNLLESEAQLRLQLEALYMQILSTLTLPTLTHLFSIRPSTDLRRPLQGTEVLLSSLADSFTRGSPSTLLSSLESLKIRKSHRQVINNTLLKARVDDLLYGLIVAGGRLVSVVRPKKHSLHPGDLQLLFNMLFEADGIKAGGGESWIPVCLPGFNNKGYLYMYVSFLNLTESNVREMGDGEHIAKEDAVAIILLSANKESFESMRSMKDYLVHELRRNRSMQIIQTAVQNGRPSPTEIVPGTGIRHFLYKSKGNVQFCMPSYLPHYETLNQRRQLLSLYHCLHASVHAKYASVKVHHSVSSSATALAWITPMFELYCVAGPLTGRNALAQGANKVVQWVQREEERLFLIGGAVF